MPRVDTQLRLTYAVFLGILAAIMLALLVGKPLTPAQEDAFCLENFSLPGPFRILLNCDSYGFMRSANAPSSLLRPGNLRQSRPIFIVAGYVASFVAAPVVFVLKALVPRLALQTLLSLYLGYLLINIALLLLAFRFYTRTIASSAVAHLYYPLVLALSGVLLVANDVVKAFIWSPIPRC
jgi:hypothetical protein